MFSLVIFALILSTGESLKCYDCNEYPEDPTNQLRLCPQPLTKYGNSQDQKFKCDTGYSCAKLVVTDSSNSFIFRTCVDKKQNLSALDDAGVTSKIYYCSEDFCNGASSTTFTASIAFFLLITLLFI